MALAQEANTTLIPDEPVVSLAVGPPQTPVSWILHALDQNKKGPAQLHIQTADGMQATCTKLAFKIGGGKQVTLSAEGNQVVVRAEHLAASADCVRRSGPEGASLSLEGHVRLHYRKKGQRAEVAASRAGIDLVTDHVDCDLGDLGTKKTDQATPSDAPLAVGVGVRFDSPARSENAVSDTGKEKAKQDSGPRFQFGPGMFR
jgi:hypothetical protein